MREFDPSDVRYGGLVAPISAADLQRFKKWTKSAPFPFPRVVAPFIGSIVHLVVDIIIWLLLMTVPVGLIIATVIGGNVILSIGFGLLGAAGIVLITWWVAKDVRQHVHLRSPWRRWLRLSRFGADNGLFYLPTSSRPPLGGTIFTYPERNKATDRFISKSGRRFEIGNYNYGKGDGSSRTKVWGYMAIGLDRVMPHMVLRAAANKKGKHGLPGRIAKDQILSLEGDFNKYFTLHAPRAYETDALYVFAPDLMALLIDEVAAYEVEIVDDWMFFYSPKPLDLGSRNALRKLMRIARIVGTKTFRQTNRYWDDRVGSFAVNHVAAPGQRLRVRVFVGSSVVAVIWGSIQLFRFVAGLHELGVGH